MAQPVVTPAPGQLNQIRINTDAQQNFVQFMRQAKLTWNFNWGMRSAMTEVDKEYARELDYTAETRKAQLANRRGDTTRFQSIIVPVIKPQIEAAVTYQSSVFLSSIPIFPCVSAPVFMDAAIQMETTIDNQATRGGWNRHLMMHFRDGFKYNIAALEVKWGQEIIPQTATDLSVPKKNAASTKQVVWAGNQLKRIDMYNCFWDVRYPPTEVAARGEYIGYDEMISLVELKQSFVTNPYVIQANIKSALESPSPTITIGTADTGLTYYIPQISRDGWVNSTVLNQFNWFQWAGLEGSNGRDLQYKNIYQRTTLYARIIPRNFELYNTPAPTFVQIWKFVFINNSILIEASPIPLGYDLLPILMTQPNEDGLAYQTKSMAQEGSSFQFLASALMNSIVASRRRSITDRVLFDPSRIDEHHINNPNPSAKIPVRPAAYGKPLAEAVYPFPFRDDQSNMNMSEIQQLMQMADQLNGTNKARQGQFQKGNKTRKEWEDVMGNSTGQDQQRSLLYEAQLFTPMKLMLKTNILQFQGPATYYNRATQQAVDVDPVTLRNAALEFTISDGIEPTEKKINGDVFANALQAMAQNPALGAGYNLTPAFSYLLKSQGADLSPFEKTAPQLAYEQAVGQWQQLCQQITESIIKQPEIDISKLKYPPQPTPDQFGYVPGTMKPSPRSPSTVTNSMMGAYQAALTAPDTTGQPPQQQPGATQ